MLSSHSPIGWLRVYKKLICNHEFKGCCDFVLLSAGYEYMQIMLDTGIPTGSTE